MLERADVVLEVLDARDPLGSRCCAVEQAVMATGVNKKLILVLNKIGAYCRWDGAVCGWDGVILIK